MVQREEAQAGGGEGGKAAGPVQQLPPEGEAACFVTPCVDAHFQQATPLHGGCSLRVGPPSVMLHPPAPLIQSLRHCPPS